MKDLKPSAKDVLKAALDRIGVQHCEMDIEEICETLVVSDEEPWVFRCSTGIVFGKTTVLFNSKDEAVGMVYSEWYNGIEKYVFEQSCEPDVKEKKDE